MKNLKGLEKINFINLEEGETKFYKFNVVTKQFLKNHNDLKELEVLIVSEKEFSGIIKSLCLNYVVKNSYGETGLLKGFNIVTVWEDTTRYQFSIVIK